MVKSKSKSRRTKPKVLPKTKRSKFALYKKQQKWTCHYERRVKQINKLKILYTLEARGNRQFQVLIKIYEVILISS